MSLMRSWYGTAFDIGGVTLSGGLTFDGTSHNDNFHGGAGDDTFNMDQGGEDTVSGRAGSDTFNFGATLDGGDRISGGTGDDTLNLTASDDLYAFDSDTISSVETIRLAPGGDYNLQFEGTTSHEHVLVEAENIGEGNRLTVSGSPTTNRSFTIGGSAGNDNIATGEQNDLIIGGGGADVLDGLGGNDVYDYIFVSESTGINFDTVAFDAKHDAIAVPDSVTAIDPAVHGGKLVGTDDVHFNASLQGRIGTEELAAFDVVVFTPKHGTWGGSTFLIIDANGVAGYQGDEDLVIRVTGGHLDHLGLGNFF